MSDQSPKFRYSRLKYPTKDRPTAHVAGQNFYICDISQSGMKMVGQHLDVKVLQKMPVEIHFMTQDKITVIIHVVRKVGDIFGVRFEDIIPREVLAHEWAYLNGTYGNVNIK